MVTRELYKNPKDYWLRRLERKFETGAIPMDRHYSSEEVLVNKISYSFSEDVTDWLMQISNQSKYALFVVLVSGIQYVLYRYKNYEEVILGTLSFEEREFKERQINKIIPLISNIESSENFKDLLENTKSEIFNAIKYQDIHLQQLQKIMSNTQQQIDTLIVMESIHKYNQAEQFSSKYNLVIEISLKQELNITSYFNANVYERDSIYRFYKHVERYFSSLMKEPDKNLDQINYLTDEEMDLLFIKFNSTHYEIPFNKTIQKLFEEQVKRKPNQVALVVNGNQFTYKEINNEANKLAHYLRNNYNIRKDDVIGLFMDRNEQLVISILAILKSGAAYVPLDPNYPKLRIEYIIKNSKLKTLIIESSHFNNIDIEQDKFIILEEHRKHINQECIQNPLHVNETSDLAYVIYTSGSTGQPKGVQINHQNVVNFIYGVEKELKINEDHSILAITSISFDLSVMELLGSMIIGLHVVLNTNEIYLGDFNQYVSPNFLNNNKPISIIQTTPSILSRIIKDENCYEFIKSLKYILIGGERINPSLTDALFDITDAKIFTMYGPTETTIWSCCVELKRDDLITLGRPLPNQQIYILDKKLKPLPIGSYGEVYIGGKGVARGYLEREEEDEEKFIVSPFVKDGMERIYKSGDIGRFLPDGRIQSMGRNDHQIKINGNRIELEEIERIIQHHENVKETVVIDKKDDYDNHILIAYVVFHKSCSSTTQEIKTLLNNYLPYYMIPNFFVEIQEFPLTLNGKINRNALREKSINMLCQVQPFKEPKNDLEKEITEIWTEILELDRIGVNDDFYLLGGDSLKAGAIINKLNKRFQVRLFLKDFLHLRTIEELAKKIPGIGTAQKNTIPLVEKKSFYPASSAQKRMYYSNQMDVDDSSYNVTGTIIINGRINKDQVLSSIRALINRHEVFRTSFELDNDILYQKIHDHADISIEYMNLLSEEEIESTVREFVRPFDLTCAPLLRIGLISIYEDYHVLVYDIHHIICDGESIRLMNSELFQIYTRQKLPDLKIQYKDYSSWQQKLLESDQIKKSESFWLEEITNNVEMLTLPTDYTITQFVTNEGRELYFNIDTELKMKIEQLAFRQGCTVNMLLLSAYFILLSRYSGQKDFIIGMPVLGRPHDDLSDCFGVFINMLCIRNQPEAQKSFVDFAVEVRESMLQAIDHQDYPFDVLYEKLNTQSKNNVNPLFEVMFNAHQVEGEEWTEAEGIRFTHKSYFNNKAKYNLTLDTTIKNECIECKFEYRTELFKEITISTMSRNFVNLLKSIVENPNMRLAQLQMLSKQDINNILFQRNQTSVPYNTNVSIHEQFEKIASEYPDKIALVHKERKLTYQELNRKSNQLAYYLRNYCQVNTEDRVGIMLDRSENLVIAMLAALKAGAAYVPIEPINPEKRTSFIIKDSKMKCILTEDRYVEKYTDITCINIVEIKNELLNLPTINIINQTQPCNLIYLMYTSGSTGNPKGVMVEHRNVINFLCAMDEKIGDIAGDSCIALTSVAFDISVLELLWTLTRGKKIIISSSDNLYEIVNDYPAPAKDNPMQFSMFFFSTYQKKTNNKYDLLLNSAKFAESNGFEAIWTPERHFHEFGGLYSNPSVISAALSTITEHIKIRSGSIVLPLHDTLRVVEEWAIVDNLSKGRVGLAFTNGWHPNDFVLNPEAYLNRTDVMYEQIEQVKKLWQGKKIERKNGIGKNVEVESFPRPIQNQLPIWVTTGGNPETYRKAGKLGLNILTHLFGQDLQTLKENIQSYHQLLEDNGFSKKDARITVMLHTFVGNDLEEVEKLVRKPFYSYIESNSNLLNSSLVNGETINLMELDHAEKEQLLELSFQKYWNKLSLMGTIESVHSIVEQLHDIGVTEIACLIDFGLEDDVILDGLSNLAKLKEEYNRKITEKKEHYTEPVSLLQCTPSTLKILLSDNSYSHFLQSLQTILIGGEKLSEQLANKLLDKTTARVFNMYGPTETTVWSSMHEVRKNECVTIGKPIANTQIYVLDEYQNPVSTNVVGEIYISGDGVARGYANLDELSNEKFINNPFVKNNTKMYRTGDLGRLLDDGSIEYIGRKDYQVKIRGFRIEIEEIEAALLDNDAVEEAVVVTQSDQNGDSHLIAFVVCNKRRVNINEIKEHLAKVLPGYMIPNQILQLEKLPLNVNNKLDRNSLPNVFDLQSQSTKHTAPRNDIERTLVEVWKEVLVAKDISVNDPFFALGGDSIKAIQISSKLLKHGLKIQLKDIFMHPTIQELSPLIKIVKNKNQTSSLPVVGEAQMAPIQQWFFEQNLMDSHHYNQSILLYRKEGFVDENLQRVLKEIVIHHDALRMTFRRNGNKISQYNKGIDAEGYAFSCFDITNEDNIRKTIEQGGNKIQSRFDLENGPLLAVALYKTKEGHYLQLSAHHLIIDGISWRVFLEDLSSGYLQITSGEDVRFPDKTSSYQDWTKYLHEQKYIQKEEEDYWNHISKEAVSPLFNNTNRFNNKVKDSKRMSFNLTKSETEKLLKSVNQAYNTEINDILLTALGLSIYQWVGSEKFFIDLEGHGREELFEDLDISRTIGWFTSLFPLSMEIKSDDIAQGIITTKERLRKIPSKGVGYGILKYINKNHDLDIEPVIMFNYLGDFNNSMKPEVFTISDLSTGHSISPESERKYLIEVIGLILDEQMTISITYNKFHFVKDDITQFNELFHNNLVSIIEHCMSVPSNQATPSDYFFNSFSFEELVKFEKYLLKENQETSGIENFYPVTPSQERMLFYTLFYQGRRYFFEQVSFELKGDVDVSLFEESLHLLMKKYDVLRSNFSYKKAKQPIQIIFRNKKGVLNYEDISMMSGYERKNYIKDYKSKDREQSFDLLRDTLLRISVLKIKKDTYSLIWSYHHIIMDGWSLGIVVKDYLNFILSSLQNNKSILSLTSSYPYSEYMKWFQKQNKSEGLAYWTKYLSNYDFSNSIETNASNSYIRKFEEFTINSSLSQALIQQAKRYGVTVNTILQVLWGITLSKFTNLNDIVFGVVSSGRNFDLDKIDEMVGLFVNVMPFRIQVSMDTQFSNLLSATQSSMALSEQFSYVSLMELQAKLNTNNSNIIDHVFVFENYPLKQNDFVNEYFAISEVKFNPQTNYNLNIVISFDSELKVNFIYNKCSYDENYINKISDYYRKLIHYIIKEEDNVLIKQLLNFK